MAQQQQPQTLEELYTSVGQENAAKLKQAATTLRSAARINLAAILVAHDLLAGKGREGRFKQWCEWEGIKYGSARVMVWAAKKENNESVKPTNTAKKRKKDRSLDLTFTFASKDDYREAFESIKRLMVTLDVATWADALLRVLAIFEGRQAA